jgi:hypothetical protein
MEAEQGGVCAICSRPETRPDRSGNPQRLSVDHCHETGQVRGLLCHSCNITLGVARDDPEHLRAMADYVERHRRPHVRAA